MYSYIFLPPIIFLLALFLPSFFPVFPLVLLPSSSFLIHVISFLVLLQTCYFLLLFTNEGAVSDIFSIFHFARRKISFTASVRARTFLSALFFVELHISFFSISSSLITYSAGSSFIQKKSLGSVVILICHAREISFTASAIWARGFLMWCNTSPNGGLWAAISPSRLHCAELLIQRDYKILNATCNFEIQYWKFQIQNSILEIEHRYRKLN